MLKRKSTEDDLTFGAEKKLIEGDITINNTPVPRNPKTSKTIYDPEGYTPVGKWVEICSSPKKLPTNSEGKAIPYSDIKRKKVKLSSPEDKVTYKELVTQDKNKKHSL